MTQHTPGPWIATPYRDSKFSHPIASFHIDGPQNQVFLADVYDGNGHHPAGANARLIAKAPEMKQILERLMATDCFTNAPSELADNARALLREIEGEQE